MQTLLSNDPRLRLQSDMELNTAEANSTLRNSLLGQSVESSGEKLDGKFSDVEEFRGLAFLARGKQSKSELPHPTTVREFLTQNKKFYVYACITGIIWPNGSDNAAHSLTKHNLRYRIWSCYLVTALFASTMIMLIVGILLLGYTQDVGGAVFCETIGMVLQNIVLYPAVVYLRREMDNKRDIDVAVYTQAFDYGLVIGRRVFIVCMLLLISLTVANIVKIQKDPSPYADMLVIVYALLLTPTQYYLCGILAFLVMEQRVSLHTMKSLQAAAESETLTRHDYFVAREGIDSRDRHTPINLLISSAMINFIISLLLFFAMADVKMSKGFLCLNIFYVFAIFGKQFIMLVIILLEVVKVNEKCDMMVKSIAKYDWGGGVEANERQRLSLYVAVKEYPIGSTIFYIRPSKFQITIHLLSMILSAAAAVFWAFAL